MTFRQSFWFVSFIFTTLASIAGAIGIVIAFVLLVPPPLALVAIPVEFVYCIIAVRACTGIMEIGTRPPPLREYE